MNVAPTGCTHPDATLVVEKLAGNVCAVPAKHTNSSKALKNEDSFSLQLLGSDNTLHMFARDELRDIVYEPKSLMPTDYDKRLTADEFANLLAFLSRQADAAPAAPPSRRPPE